VGASDCAIDRRLSEKTRSYRPRGALALLARERPAAIGHFGGELVEVYAASVPEYAIAGEECALDRLGRLTRAERRAFEV